MSTDLELHQQPYTTLETTTYTDPTGGRLVAWAAGLAAAHQIGSALCRTAFAPKHFAGKPEEAAAAIMFGDEIGLTPTQSLRSIHVISGTPGLSARAMVALVQSKGHEVWTELDTPEKVVVCGRRRGTQNIERSEWTTARARKAGYTNNKKYETDPQAMLYARAASDICRKVAADALAGLAYTVEEMELEAPQPTTTISRSTSEPKTTTTRRRQPEPAPMPEPDLEPPTLSADEPIPADDQPAPPLEDGAGITQAQSRMLHAALKEAGMGERDAGLAYIADVLDREVASSKELSKADASKVIDALVKSGEQA